MRTHLGSAQTLKKGGKGRKDVVARRMEHLKEDFMDLHTGVNNEITSVVKTVKAVHLLLRTELM